MMFTLLVWTLVSLEVLEFVVNLDRASDGSGSGAKAVSICLISGLLKMTTVGLEGE